MYGFMGLYRVMIHSLADQQHHLWPDDITNEQTLPSSDYLVHTDPQAVQQRAPASLVNSRIGFGTKYGEYCLGCRGNIRSLLGKLPTILFQFRRTQRTAEPCSGRSSSQTYFCAFSPDVSNHREASDP
jgi:hypothetical protein